MPRALTGFMYGVTYNAFTGTALIQGTGGFTQISMSQRDAEALAQILGLDFYRDPED
jgi:hypothetical protein